MNYLLFVAYLLLFLWLLRRIRFFRESGLTRRQVEIVFLLKVFAGIVYGWVGTYYSLHGEITDTWWLHYEGIREKGLLLHDPARFFTDFLHNGYSHGFARFLSSRDSWWNDLHTNVFIKLLALLDVLTGDSYYINALFFGFFTMAGPIALFRIFHRIYPHRKAAVFAGAFLVPSYLFWTSGIFRDAPVAVALGLILYCFHTGLTQGWKLKYVLTVAGGLFMLLVFRNYLVVVILPALLAWWVSARSRFHPLAVFTSIYGVYAVLFFCLRYLVPALDFPQMAVEKQEDFFTLVGNSKVASPVLAPTFRSFVANSWHALSLAALRPSPADVYNPFILLACVETYALLALFAWWIFRHSSGRTVPTVAFCLFFSFTLFLVIGFTVNFLGSTVRYRSVALPLLVTPMLGTIRFRRNT